MVCESAEQRGGILRRLQPRHGDDPRRDRRDIGPQPGRDVEHAVMDDVEPILPGQALVERQIPLVFTDANDGGSPAGGRLLGPFGQDARTAPNSIADRPAMRRVHGRYPQPRGDRPADPAGFGRVHAHDVGHEFAHGGGQFARRQEVADGVDRAAQAPQRVVRHAGRLQQICYRTFAAGQHQHRMTALDHLARHVAHVDAGAAHGIRTRDDVKDPHDSRLRETRTMNASFRKTAAAIAGAPGRSSRCARGARAGVSFRR